jgi:FKBP12-rapamycin complex-associated protein
MSEKEKQYRNQDYLVKLIESSYQGLKTNHVEIIHGSLITYRELLLHAGMVGVYPFNPRSQAEFS